MKFSEWKNDLFLWVSVDAFKSTAEYTYPRLVFQVTRCNLHKKPPTSLEDANIEEFFAEYLKLTELHFESRAASSLAVNGSLLIFLSGKRNAILYYTTL